MRVFIVGSGRCGSTTFFKAASHITNYAVAQESVFLEFPPKIDYPDSHIEISCPLNGAVALLRRKYPDCCLVYLTRDFKQCAESLARLKTPRDQFVMSLWSELYCGLPVESFEQRLAVAEYYVATRDAAIRAANPDMLFSLEHAEADWRWFWTLVHAEGDFSASLAEWSVKHNSGEFRGEL